MIKYFSPSSPEEALSAITPQEDEHVEVSCEGRPNILPTAADVEVWFVKLDGTRRRVVGVTGLCFSVSVDTADLFPKLRLSTFYVDGSNHGTVFVDLALTKISFVSFGREVV